MAAKNPGFGRMAREAKHAWSDDPVYTFWGEWGVRNWFLLAVGNVIVLTIIMTALQQTVSLSIVLTALWGGLAIVFIVWLWTRARDELAKSEGWGGARIEETIED